MMNLNMELVIHGEPGYKKERHQHNCTSELVEKLSEGFQLKTENAMAFINGLGLPLWKQYVFAK